MTLKQTLHNLLDQVNQETDLQLELKRQAETFLFDSNHLNHESSNFIKQFIHTELIQSLSEDCPLLFDKDDNLTLFNKRFLKNLLLTDNQSQVKFHP